MNKLASLSLLALGLVACADDPPTPSEVRSAISNDLGHVITEANAAGSGAAEAAPGEAGMAMIDRMLGESESEIAVRMRSKVTAFVVEREVKNAVARMAAPEDPVEEEDPAAEIVGYLNDNLFTDANHLGEGVYKVPAELVCTESTYDEQTGEISEQLDPECAADFDKAQVRIRVSGDAGDMRFALQMTEDKEEPLVATLKHDSVALTVDFDDAWRSAVALAEISGEALPNAELSGQVTSKLSILGSAHAAFAVTIDRDLSIKLAGEGDDLNGPEAFRVTSKQAEAFSISANGPAKSGALSLGIAETYLHVPPLFVGPSSEDENGSTEPGETFELDLAGLTATATFAQGQPVTVTNIGIGDRELVTKLNGRVSSWTAINPDDGRTFDATITDDATTGRSTISVSPKLDLRTFTDHAVQGTQPAVYDVTRVLLAGSLSGDALSSTVKVESGSYSIETNPAGYGFSATAGECVSATESFDETSGSYYTAYSVGACQ